MGRPSRARAGGQHAGRALSKPPACGPAPRWRFWRAPPHAPHYNPSTHAHTCQAAAQGVLPAPLQVLERPHQLALLLPPLCTLPKGALARHRQQAALVGRVCGMGQRGGGSEGESVCTWACRMVSSRLLGASHAGERSTRGRQPHSLPDAAPANPKPPPTPPTRPGRPPTHPPAQPARSPVSQCTRCTVRGSGTTSSTPVAVLLAGYSASRRRYRVSCRGAWPGQFTGTGAS